MSYTKITILSAVFLFFFTACEQNNNSEKNDKNKKVEVKYAKNFLLEKNKKGSVLKVINPWQNAKDIIYKYSPNENMKVPARRVICLSTTHIGFLDLLGETNTIVGISGINYVYNQDVRKRIAEGKIKDVGYAENLNIELVLSLHPDIVFVYGVESSITSKISEMEKLGINVVIIAEYLEEEPLGKAEWLRFFARFYKKEKLADSLFNQIANKYESLKNKVKTAKNKPGVLVNIPYQGVWYVPGGQSYFAKLIADAGGNYLWKDDNKNESYPIGFEAVYAKQENAEILLNPSSAKSIDEILQIEPKLQFFSCIDSPNVYNNNLRVNEFGGNDFWESAVVQPDLVLKDLVKIFQPQLLPNDSLFYYQKLD